MPSHFALLPSELILSIFGFAATDRPTACALSLVSTWVHAHVEPILYHTVTLSSTKSLTAFLTTISAKPDNFALQRVKHLGIMALGPIESIEEALSRCTGVTSLACGFSVPSYVHCARGVPIPDASPYKLAVSPTEQHLLGRLTCRDGIDMSIISPAVTRLRIQITSETTSQSLSHLLELHKLTHLAVIYRNDIIGGLSHVREMLYPILEKGQLKVLLLQVAGAGNEKHLKQIEEWNATATISNFSNSTKIHDWRIVAEKAPRSPLQQWRNGDLWDCAERIVRSRIRNRGHPLLRRGPSVVGRVYAL
ncbi:hypothetical protein BJ138DRAFT_1139222 [Hygrophoropsis aurantiaca]|uniref:Uncharacterized protein n=1 Tax=Hygrophoropsis aurantiaca TaxID=72124 RepID=A0ACB8ATG8_9AGAM|nr:hypothetical protein BJ138DRAFT_1139222 [Hygrophoropsis aurantiaca]